MWDSNCSEYGVQYWEKGIPYTWECGEESICFHFKWCPAGEWVTFYICKPVKGTDSFLIYIQLDI